MWDIVGLIEGGWKYEKNYGMSDYPYQLKHSNPYPVFSLSLLVSDKKALSKVLSKALQFFAVLCSDV